MSSENIIAALTAEDSPFQARAIDLVLDQVLGTPVGELIDVQTLVELSVTALSEPHLERVVERHVVGTIAAVRETLAGSGQPVGDAVPGPQRDDILALLASAKGPRLTWLQGALDPKLIRDLLAPVFQDVLLGFAAKIPGAVGGAAGGAVVASAGAVMGKLGSTARSGARLLNAGRTAVGAKGKSKGKGKGKDSDDAYGDGTAGPFGKLAQDFSRGAVSAFQESLQRRLRSQEGAALLAELQAGALDHVLGTQIQVIDEDLQRLPLADILALAPPLVAHNLGRDLGQRAVRVGLDEFFVREGERPLGELLDDWGVEADLRAMLRDRGLPVVRGLFASDAFRSFMDDLLAAG